MLQPEAAVKQHRPPKSNGEEHRIKTKTNRGKVGVPRAQTLRRRVSTDMTTTDGRAKGETGVGVPAVGGNGIGTMSDGEACNEHGGRRFHGGKVLTD